MAARKKKTQIDEAAKVLVNDFKRVCQKDTLTPDQQKLAARSFVSGVCSLADAGQFELTEQEWAQVFETLGNQLSKYEM